MIKSNAFYNAMNLIEQVNEIKTKKYLFIS